MLLTDGTGAAHKFTGPFDKLRASSSARKNGEPEDVKRDGLRKPKMPSHVMMMQSNRREDNKACPSWSSEVRDTSAVMPPLL